MFLKHNQFSIAVFVAIFLLCLLPGDEVPCLMQENLDKVLHTGLFALFSFSAIIGFLKQYQFPFLAKNAVKIVVLLAISYGVVIEVVQDLFITDRSFEWLDIVADWIGVVFGLGVYLLIKGKENFA